MDKQKQTFEEMVKELAKDMGIAFQLANTTRFGVISADLIRIGYRKIPEGALVLTREELHDKGYRKVCEPVIRNGEVVGFVNGADYVPKNLFLFGVANTRKETAEKFAERVSKAFIGLNCIDIDEWNWCQRKIDEICKEITERNNGTDD